MYFLGRSGVNHVETETSLMKWTIFDSRNTVWIPQEHNSVEIWNTRFDLPVQVEDTVR